MKTIEITTITCCTCGTTYGIDETLREFRKDDGKAFFCPNGHSLSYATSRQSKLDEALKELAELKVELNDAQVEIRRLKCELLTKRGPSPQTHHALWDQ